MAGEDGKKQSKSVRAPAPPPPQQVQRRSVVEPPDSLEFGPGGGNQFVFWMASIADIFSPWGQNYFKRDEELRDFWHTESNLASAVYTCGISNAGLEWELEGPDRTVKAVHDLLNEADGGKGFQHYVKKISTDLYTQDNGSFTEIIRSGNSRAAPIIAIQHLDAAMCQRTGDLKIPVIYTDRKGVRHKMPWYSIITHEEFPSPVEAMFNVQYCAVTRVLRSAQILRDFAIYRGEKAGGRFTERINIIGGVKQSDIDDIQRRNEHEADNKGLVRYMFPMMIASLDPQTTPSVATIDFKSLPEGFDIDTELKWYINSLALGFGRDYQEFAPLPGRGIGSGQQSETMHLKSRGKGPKAFMDMIMHDFNFHGVMPRTVTFRYKEQDVEEEFQIARARKTRAEDRKLRLDSLEITPEIARQLAQDDGDLKPEYLQMMGEGDLTPDVPVEGDEPQTDTGSAHGSDHDIEKALEARFGGRAIKFFRRSETKD